MIDLLSEMWVLQKPEEAVGKKPSQAKAQKKLQDINVWLQCFAMFVEVVSSKSPECVPELMAYHHQGKPGV